MKSNNNLFVKTNIKFFNSHKDKCNYFTPLSILVLLTLLFSNCSPKVTTTVTSDVLKTMKPADVLQRLADGNQRFMSGKMIHYDYAQQIHNSSKQSPPALIMGCMDSRTSPEMVFNQGIGDIFSLRMAGFFVTPESIGSMEYACYHCGTKLIVVMGHAHCGAVKGVIPIEKKAEAKHDEDEVPLTNLTTTLGELKIAYETAQKDPRFKTMTYDEKVALVVETNVKETMREIEHDSPALKEKIDKGELLVVGAVYDIDNGKVTFLDHVVTGHPTKKGHKKEMVHH